MAKKKDKKIIFLISSIIIIVFILFFIFKFLNITGNVLKINGIELKGKIAQNCTNLQTSEIDGINDKNIKQIEHTFIISGTKKIIRTGDLTNSQSRFESYYWGKNETILRFLILRDDCTINVYDQPNDEIKNISESTIPSSETLTFETYQSGDKCYESDSFFIPINQEQINECKSINRLADCFPSVFNKRIYFYSCVKEEICKSGVSFVQKLEWNNFRVAYKGITDLNNNICLINKTLLI